MKTIQITRNLEGPASMALFQIAVQWGLNIEPEGQIVLAHSHTKVDWDASVFQPQKGKIEFTADNLRFERKGALVALTFTSEEIEKRRAEILAAGAHWDHPEGRAYIALGYDPNQEIELPPDDIAPRQFRFGPEMRRELFLKAKMQPKQNLSAQENS